MRALVGDKWVDGLLSPWRADDEYRIEVQAWATVAELTGIYFVRERSARAVFNYLGEVRPADMARKIRSRLAESARNEKFVSCGIGKVVEAPSEPGFRAGKRVLFVAPLHPRCADELCLPEGLLRAWPSPGLATDIPPGWLLHLSDPPAGTVAAEAAKVGGWSRYSGEALDRPEVQDAVDRLAAFAQGSSWGGAAMLETGRSRGADRRAAFHEVEGGKPTVALFGYGHYAKTTALPNIGGALELAAVHEIDPLQLPRDLPDTISWSTSPLPDEDEHDVYMVAGYHHTHAPLAANALRRGASVIMEKPAAVSSSQLDDLLAALSESSGSLHVCFQRRYTSFNDFAREDLDILPGKPINYHCIVYEVPLPPLHWYRWPNSGSRLVSNGCHWIDHFLYLNDHAEVCDHALFAARDGTLNVTLELSNGATFSMVLTEVGSERLGVRDHVELRAGDVTVTITNNRAYKAEDSNRVLRRRRTTRGAAYARMYEVISSRIVQGDPGDSSESLERSTKTMLELEAIATQLFEQAGH